MLAHNVTDRTEDVLLNVNVSFESLLLSKNVLAGLTNAGFKKPSPIQLKAIPIAKCGFDLIIKSKSGTGKTLIFAIALLETVDVSKNDLQGLILAPTREIAVQIEDVLCVIGKECNGLNVKSFIGGLPIEDDREKSKACHVAVGTPGRLKHLIKEGFISTGKVKIFVLDEADKLMEENFYNDINEIYNTLPSKKQVITTSATYPDELQNILKEYMFSPVCINVEKSSPLLLGLRQFVRISEGGLTAAQVMHAKNQQLCNIFFHCSFFQCLIFFNYQTRAESVNTYLIQQGWKSKYISAAQTQKKRLAAINDLKRFKCRILLTTDLIARGIDAANVDLVINYDIPNSPLTYLHRMGRAGRYGASGVCINLVTEFELVELTNILGAIGGTELSIPILREFHGSINELLQIEISPDDFVKGTVDEKNVFDIRTDLIDIKNQLGKVVEKHFNTKKKKKRSSQVNSEEILDMKRNISNIENDESSDTVVVKKEIEKNTKSKKESVISTTLKDTKDDLEQSLNNSSNKTDQNSLSLYDQDLEVVKKKIEHLNAEDILQALAGGNFDFSGIPSNFKNSISEVESSNNQQIETGITTSSDALPSCNEDSKTVEPEIETIKCEDVLQENFDFSSIPSLCYNDTQFVDKDDDLTSENIPVSLNESDDDYVDCGQADNKEAEEKAYKTPNAMCTKEFINIFKENCDINEEGSSKNNEMDCYINDIFKIGFKTILNKEDNVWLDMVEKCIDENPNGESDEDYSEDCIELNDKIKLEATVLDTSEVTEAHPHTNNSLNKIKTENDVDNYEHFGRHFDLCGLNLWENGLNFSDVHSFDRWFYYRWDAELRAVRDYVQKNIYVQEMGRFQNQ